MTTLQESKTFAFRLGGFEPIFERFCEEHKVSPYKAARLIISDVLMDYDEDNQKKVSRKAVRKG